MAPPTASTTAQLEEQCQHQETEIAAFSASPSPPPVPDSPNRIQTDQAESRAQIVVSPGQTAGTADELVVVQPTAAEAELHAGISGLLGTAKQLRASREFHPILKQQKVCTAALGSGVLPGGGGRCNLHRVAPGCKLLLGSQGRMTWMNTTTAVAVRFHMYELTCMWVKGCSQHRLCLVETVKASPQ